MPIGARAERQVVRHHGLAQQRLGDAGAEQLGHLDQFVVRAVGAGAGQDRDLGAGVEHVGGRPQGLGGRHRRLLRRADTGEGVAVFARRPGRRVFFLQVAGHDHAGHAAPRLGDAHRAVDQVAHLRRRARLLHELAGHVLEQGDQVDLLLVVRAQRRALLLSDDGDHGLVIELGIVQAIEQVDGAGAGRGQADPDLVRELGVAGGHEGRQLFVAALDEVDRILAPEGGHDAIDAVARIAVDAPYAPLAQALEDEVSHGAGHAHSFRWLDRPARRGGGPGSLLYACESAPTVRQRPHAAHRRARVRAGRRAPGRPPGQHRTGAPALRRRAACASWRARRRLAPPRPRARLRPRSAPASPPAWRRAPC